MSFNYGQYFIVVLLGWILFLIFYLKNQKSFFAWVKDHWFYERSFTNKISSIFYITGILLLALALLDLRGEEKLVTGKQTDQKTIILIDSSASMLVEDVRPNRFERALVLAKHYIKRAAGQNISLVVFSDKAKRIVPFTEDNNLVSARLERLKNLNIGGGGTSLTLAIKESMQYFINNEGEVTGNILLFTDAEETDGGIDIEVPSTVSVAIVGVGTSTGGPIPLRNARGVSRGKKKHQGKVVISKLDENFIKSLGEKIENFRYWIATSYSLPTQEILNFFSRIHEQKNEENSFRVKPVLTSYLMIPGMILLMLSFLLGRRKMFVAQLLALVFFVPNNSYAQEKEKRTKSDKTRELEEEFIQGRLSNEGKKAYASSLLKDDFNADAASLYDEILGESINETNVLDKFNQATANIKSGKVRKGLDQYNSMLDYLKENPSDQNNKLLDVVKKNLATLFRQAQGQGQGSKSKKDDSNEKNKNNQDKSGKGESSSKDDKNNKDQNDDENKDQDSKDGKDKPKDQKDPDKEDNKDKKKSADESSDERKERKKKLPALLKQLVNDDNQLQKKLIDANTTERKKYGDKDW